MKWINFYGRKTKRGFNDIGDDAVENYEAIKLKGVPVGSESVSFSDSTWRKKHISKYAPIYIPNPRRKPLSFSERAELL